MTPAVVAAEGAGIPFTLHEYEHDPKAESYGLEAAEKTGVDPARVFKTLVVSQDGALSVAIVPVAAQLDLRALGKRAGLADISAGRRGLELELAPDDLVRLTEARVAAVASRA